MFKISDTHEAKGAKGKSQFPAGGISFSITKEADTTLGITTERMHSWEFLLDQRSSFPLEETFSHF